MNRDIKSIAIGSFDGVHLAHQKLISLSDGVVVIERNKATLTPGWKRVKYIKKPTFFYHLQNIKNLSPKEFIKRLQQDFSNLEAIVVGYDFRFGKDKSGSIDTIKSYFKKEVIVVDEIKYKDISIHSRVIRELISKNNISLANRLLDRFYTIDGYQIRGQGLGKKELVPTINLKVINYTLPQGVFATIAKIDGKKYKSVTFIGNRVSTDNSFSVEFFIIDKFDKGFIKDIIELEFIDFIRENQKFNSLKSLKEQINRDILRAKEILKPF